jgi:putative transposase
VRVPKLGWVRFRWSRAPLGEIRHLTICRDALGWHISLCTKQERAAPQPHSGPPVGIDRGITSTVALSTGALYSCPELPPGQAARLRRLVRKAGRQETIRRRQPPNARQRSRRHQRTLDQIARLRAREARIRRNFLHGLSHNLAARHGLVALEALRVQNMTRSARGTRDNPGTQVAQKAGLNRAILAQGWGQLRTLLAYKVEARGGELLEVPPEYTSQTCAECGHVSPANRIGVKFACRRCGHRGHADINAARVILARALEGNTNRGRTWPSQHGEPSANAWSRTVNRPEEVSA